MATQSMHTFYLHVLVLYRSTFGTLPPSLSSGSIKTVRTYSASTTGIVRCSLLLERARYFRRDKKRDVCLVVRYVHGVLVVI